MTDTLRRRALVLTAAATGAAGLLPAGALRAATHTATPTSPDPAAALRAAGTVVLMRHARTEPGIGDPPGYDLQVCTSQRQLSDEGREQSRRIGAWFAERGLRPTAVRSSHWCRCQDTGTLAFPGLAVRPWTALDSTFAERAGRAAGQTAEARRALAALRGRAGFEVWVSHMVNIQALAGRSVAMGEALVVRAGRTAEGAGAAGAEPGAEVLAQWQPGG